jgi:hypothetical protein
MASRARTKSEPGYTKSSDYRRLVQETIGQVQDVLGQAKLSRTSREAADRDAEVIAGHLITAMVVESYLERERAGTTKNLTKIKGLRHELKVATKRESRLRGSKSLEAWLTANAKLDLARLRLRIAVESENTRQNDLSKPSGKHVVSEKFDSIVPLVQDLFYDHGLSDSAIHDLLHAVRLPSPTTRNLKSIRLASRRKDPRPARP